MCVLDGPLIMYAVDAVSVLPLVLYCMLHNWWFRVDNIYIYIMMVQFNIYIQHDTTFNRNICIHSTIMVFHHLVFFRRHSLCPASLRSSQEAPDMWGTMGTHELGQIPYWTMASVRCLIFWGCNWNSLFWSLLYFFGGWNWNALFCLKSLCNDFENNLCLSRAVSRPLQGSLANQTWKRKIPSS